MRATAGSVISVADSLVAAVFAPLAAIVGQQLGLGWAILISAVLYATIGAADLRKVSAKMHAQWRNSLDNISKLAPSDCGSSQHGPASLSSAGCC